MKPTESNICPVHNLPMNYHANGKPCCKPHVAHLCQAAPPPSDPLGVAAVLLPCPFCGDTGEILKGSDKNGDFTAIECKKCGAGSGLHYFLGGDAKQCAIDAWNTRYQPTTPTREPAEGEPMACPHCSSILLWSEDRGAHCDGCDEYDPEPAEGATPLTDAQSKNIYGGDTGMVSAEFARSLETALAEAKARRAEAATKRDAYESEAKSLNGFIAKANVENERLRAECERLAALVEETKKERDMAKTGWESANLCATDLQSQLTAAQAQIAAKDAVFIEIIKACGVIRDKGLVAESDHVVDIADNALSPSCGAELLAKIASLEQQAVYDNEAIERMQRVGAENEVKLADLTARIAKLEGDEERLDWIEAEAKKSYTGISFDWCKHAEDGYVVEKGFRFMRRHFLGERKDNIRLAIDAARQALDSAPEGRGA